VQVPVSYSKRTTIFQRGEDLAGTPPIQPDTAIETTQARCAARSTAASLSVLGDFAAECVVHAETKDHLNWELLGFAANAAKGELRQALKEAHEKVEPQEDEHLYHTKDWSRELWIQTLGMPAVLPPPEEAKDVKTAIGAARAKMARGGARPGDLDIAAALAARRRVARRVAGVHFGWHSPPPPISCAVRDRRARFGEWRAR